MHTKMTKNHKLMAYLLNKTFNYQMSKIAQLMGVSQSTISTSIKDVEWWIKERDLTKELEEAKDILASNGIVLPKTPPIRLNLVEKIQR